MRRMLLVFMGLGLLCLMAADIRLLGRVRHLEEELTRAQARLRKSDPREAETGPRAAALEEHSLPRVEGQATSGRARGASLGPSLPAAGDRHAPQGSPSPEAGGAGSPQRPVTVDLHGAQFVLSPRLSDEELGLTTQQKAALDALRANRDLQTKAYQDLIDKIDQSTEEDIRRLLDASQLAKYDATRNLVQVVQQASVALSSGAGPRPGYLGINGTDAEGGGAQITGVMANTAASGVGLQPGDVILSVNGEAVSGLSDLAAKIGAAQEGTPINLKIRRSGAEFYQGIQLGPRQ